MHMALGTAGWQRERIFPAKRLDVLRDLAQVQLTCVPEPCGNSAALHSATSI